jgi:amino acid adenylation domain-containing protein
LNHFTRSSAIGGAYQDTPVGLVSRFEAQAKQTPDAIALEQGSHRVTYRDLNENANRLAHRLIQAGAAPEIRVGLYMESGASLIVAMLAVWKAGAAFVPFDVSLPPRRLAMLCAEADLLLILTSHASQRGLAHFNLPLLAVDGAFPDFRATNPHIPATSNNLAYLIFTSGTTGIPKAVAIEHESLANLLHWANEEILPTATDRSAQIAAVGFDAIFLELWPYLLNGGTICFPSRTDRQSPEHLQRWLLYQRISVIVATTPLCEALLALYWPPDSALRTMIVGGDRLRKCPDPSHPFQLMNVYGPTENTVVSTATIVSATPGANLPLIGPPIPGQDAIILDENLLPVPAGTIGELYLIGKGLARYYHGDPRQTAARFVPCPYSLVSGARMFRSGDFARTMPNGDIDFVGRQDRQIKILGHRVDLAEIEACLLHHGDITDVAVVTDELPDMQRYITAYVVTEKRAAQNLAAETGDANSNLPHQRRPGSQALIESIRTFAAARLPAYMCPSAYQIVASLPVTDNGKLDRKALQNIVQRDTNLENLSPDGQLLARIFCDLLGISTLGPDSDFFAYGGHSLLAARLVRDISRDFGISIAITEIYQHPRLDQLASLITARRARRREHRDVLSDCVVPIQTSGTGAAFFCVAPAGGSPMCYRKLANYLDEDQRILGLQSQGLGDNKEPLTGVEDIAATYVAAIRQVQPSGPYHIGGWSFGAIVAWEMAVQLAEQGQQVGQLALLDGWVGPPRYARRGARLWDAGAIVAMSFRFLRQIKLPRTYDGLHELAQWVGIGLPDSLVYLRQATWRVRSRIALRMIEEAYRSLRVFKANATAALRYRPRPYRGGCVLYRTSMNGSTGNAERVASDLRELTGGALQIVTLDGTHMSLMMEDAHIATLAAALATQLRNAQATAGTAALV